MHSPTPPTPLPSYTSLARKLSIYTTNLLATAIVLVLGLTLGWQVLAWWRDQPDASTGAAATSAQLPSQLENYEFLTTHGTLKIERFYGDADQALVAMRSFQRATVPARQMLPPAGQQEQRLLDQLKSQPALEQVGDLAFHQPPDQKLMVAAVSRSQQRIVGWSFALPAEDGSWSLFHIQARSATREGEAPAEPTLPLMAGGRP
jgi:hypothetical protein